MWNVLHNTTTKVSRKGKVWGPQKQSEMECTFQNSMQVLEMLKAIGSSLLWNLAMHILQLTKKSKTDQHKLQLKVHSGWGYDNKHNMLYCCYVNKFLLNARDFLNINSTITTNLWAVTFKVKINIGAYL
jgi:hypothetical protein